MTIQITGKNLDAGDAFKTYAGDKISAVLQKYLGRVPDGHIRLERERGLFKTSCSVRLTNGLLLETCGEAADAYASADSAAHRLEMRVRRYKSRIKNHSAAEAAARRRVEAPDYVVGVSEEDGDDAHQAEANPLIIAEGQRDIDHMTVSEAVMQLDLSEASFMIFKNAAHGGLNVVYRRNDGHIGWVDAEAQAAPLAKKSDAAQSAD